MRPISWHWIWKTNVEVISQASHDDKLKVYYEHHVHWQFILVEWAIALYGMYKSALVFISILKQKNLYLVGCVQCNIWDITAYLLLSESKYYCEK
jgi:hypothetical protein